MKKRLFIPVDVGPFLFYLVLIIVRNYNVFYYYENQMFIVVSVLDDIAELWTHEELLASIDR